MPDPKQDIKKKFMKSNANTYSRIATRLDIENSRKRGHKLPSEINKDLQPKNVYSKDVYDLNQTDHRGAGARQMKRLYGQEGVEEYKKSMNRRRESSSKKLKKVDQNLKQEMMNSKIF